MSMKPLSSKKPQADEAKDVPDKKAGSKGVMFWRPARLDAAGQPPRFFYRRDKKRPARAVAGSCTYSRIEYPVNSGVPLSIHGARVIDDLAIVLHMLATNKDPRKVIADYEDPDVLSNGGMAGALLHDSQNAMEFLDITQAEYDDLVKRNTYPEKYAHIGLPGKPPVFDKMSESQLDAYALGHDVQRLVAYDKKAPRPEKVAALEDYLLALKRTRK